MYRLGTRLRSTGPSIILPPFAVNGTTTRLFNLSDRIRATLLLSTQVLPVPGPALRSPIPTEARVNCRLMSARTQKRLNASNNKKKDCTEE